jgi:SAM-dependent methyltransferase
VPAALERWRDELEAWAIPEAIIRAAPESPWSFPVDLFRRRADRAMAGPPAAGHGLALEALPVGGTVLDVGCGAGAASLPFASRASLIVGVDPSPEMLREFLGAAASVGARVEAVEGEWPRVAPTVPVVDVVVCQHVLYNVPDLEPFTEELDRHARTRVVVVITQRHPLSWLNDLWIRFHGLERPNGPTAADAVKALQELGIDARREDRVITRDTGGFSSRGDAVAFVRRRLCLAPDQDFEIAEALGERLAERDGLWFTGPAARRIAAIWWDR